MVVLVVHGTFRTLFDPYCVTRDDELVCLDLTGMLYMFKTYQCRAGDVRSFTTASTSSNLSDQGCQRDQLRGQGYNSHVCGCIYARIEKGSE